MELHEILNICLLALESRRPTCVIEVNEAQLGRPGCWGEACAPGEMLKVLQRQAPRLLQAPARLVIDEAQSAIYLGECSEEEPAFWVYCGGCTPAQRARQQARQLLAV
jgi:hypothetical protein